MYGSALKCNVWRSNKVYNLWLLLRTEEKFKLTVQGIASTQGEFEGMYLSTYSPDHYIR